MGLFAGAATTAGASRLAGRRPWGFVWQRQIVAAVYDRRLGAHRAPLQCALARRHRDSQGALGVVVQSHFFRSLSIPACLSRSAGLQPGTCPLEGGAASSQDATQFWHWRGPEHFACLAAYSMDNRLCVLRMSPMLAPGEVC